MCKVWDDIRTETTVKYIKILMSDLSLTLRETLKLLRIPLSEEEKYRKLILNLNYVKLGPDNLKGDELI